MKTFLVLLFLSTSGLVNAKANSCSNWAYASLSFASEAVIEENEAKGVYTFVIWQTPTEHGMWQNNNPLPAKIKTTLTEYFGIKTINPHNILNRIGAKGWEAYGYHATQVSATDKSRELQFKKCGS